MKRRVEFLKRFGHLRARGVATARGDGRCARTSEDASVMTYSSARGAVEDAGAGARARGMTVTNAMEDDSFSLTRGFRDSLTIHDS